MDSGTVEQMRRILADQQNGLRELRSKRKEYRDRLAETDTKEIEYLLGIKTTKEILADMEAVD